MLLEPDFRAQLERLALRSDRRVRGMWSGSHASVQRGESLDFADYREYTPGDDFRRIDHSLWARLGVVLVRLFEAEDELPLRVVVDRSQSMNFGEKWPTAQRLAAVVGFLTLAGGDRLSPLATPGMAGAPFSARQSLRHLGGWPALEDWIERLEPEGVAHQPAVARFVAGQTSQRGPTVIISDFLGGGSVDALDTFGYAGGGVALHVLAPDELDPDFSGDLRLIDSETGDEVNVSTTPEAMASYREAVDEFVAEVAQRARRNGIEHVLVPAVADAHRQLVGALVRTQLVR